MHNATHSSLMPRFRTLGLLGAGVAAAGLGTYIYKKPRLRRKMWRAGSVAGAAMELGQEIRHDSAEVADTVVSTMSQNAADSLRTVRSTLGSRFGRGKRALKHEARRLKREAKRTGTIAKAEGKLVAATAKHEAKHMRNEVAQSAQRFAEKSA
jgi:hypothetical protein